MGLRYGLLGQSANARSHEQVSFDTAAKGRREVIRRSQVLLYRNVQRFPGGLVVKVHRLLYHSTLGLRVIKKTRTPPAAQLLIIQLSDAIVCGLRCAPRLLSAVGGDATGASRVGDWI